MVRYHNRCITALLNLLRHVARKTRWGNTNKIIQKHIRLNEQICESIHIHTAVKLLPFFWFHVWDSLTLTDSAPWELRFCDLIIIIIFFCSCGTRSHALCAFATLDTRVNVCERHFEDRQCGLMRLLALCEQDSTDNASHLNAKPGLKLHC